MAVLAVAGLLRGISYIGMVCLGGLLRQTGGCWQAASTAIATHSTMCKRLSLSDMLKLRRSRGFAVERQQEGRALRVLLGLPPSIEPAILKVHLAGQELVDLAVARRIEQDHPLTLSQALAQVKANDEGSLPHRSLRSLALNLHVEFLEIDLLVLCDRSDGEYDSRA